MQQKIIDILHNEKFPSVLLIQYMPIAHSSAVQNTFCQFFTLDPFAVFSLKKSKDHATNFNAFKALSQKRVEVA